MYNDLVTICILIAIKDARNLPTDLV